MTPFGDCGAVCNLCNFWHWLTIGWYVVNYLRQGWYFDLIMIYIASLYSCSGLCIVPRISYVMDIGVTSCVIMSAKSRRIEVASVIFSICTRKLMYYRDNILAIDISSAWMSSSNYFPCCSNIRQSIDSSSNIDGPIVSHDAINCVFDSHSCFITS